MRKKARRLRKGRRVQAPALEMMTAVPKARRVRRVPKARIATKKAMMMRATRRAAPKAREVATGATEKAAKIVAVKATTRRRRRKARA